MRVFPSPIATRVHTFLFHSIDADRKSTTCRGNARYDPSGFHARNYVT
jgi:hypothetical protein